MSAKNESWLYYAAMFIIILIGFRLLMLAIDNNEIQYTSYVNTTVLDMKEACSLNGCFVYLQTDYGTIRGPLTSNDECMFTKVNDTIELSIYNRTGDGVYSFERCYV